MDNKSIIIHNICKTMSYQLLCECLSNDDKLNYIQYSELYRRHSGVLSNINSIKKLYEDPSQFGNKITEERFSRLLQQLIIPNNVLCENKKRSISPYIFKSLMLITYYNYRISYAYTNSKKSIEHIVPYSCIWENSIDINRLGNLSIIALTKNCKRQNKHLQELYNNSRSNQSIKTS